MNKLPKSGEHCLLAIGPDVHLGGKQRGMSGGPARTHLMIGIALSEGEQEKYGESYCSDEVKPSIFTLNFLTKYSHHGSVAQCGTMILSVVIWQTG